jgi:hypothetical protein
MMHRYQLSVLGVHVADNDLINYVIEDFNFNTQVQCLEDKKLT